MNALVFVPPAKAVIDAWESLGNPGWNWNTLQNYFAKTYSVQALDEAERRHLGVSDPTGPNQTGPIQTSYPSHLENFIPKAWNETFATLGYQMIKDPFLGAASGSFSSLASIDPRSGDRSYSATSYLQSVSERKNLHVWTGCLVEKILFGNDAQKSVATGVKFQQDGKSIIAKCRLEVILAAGSIQSPKILELSGIGSQELLTSCGIEVIIDNPHVGENMQDHLICRIGLVGFGSEGASLTGGISAQELEPIDAAIVKYMKSKAGKASLSDIPSYAYLPVIELLGPSGQIILQTLLDSSTPKERDPLNPIAQEYYEIAGRMLQNNGEASGAYIYVNFQTDKGGLPPGKMSTVGAMLSNPLSRGTVHITSSVPLAPPKINPKYLTHPLDLEIYARHIKYLETISITEPLRSAILSQGGHVAEPTRYFDDLEVAKEYVRRKATSMWHPTSTCSMLPKEKGGVVDERLVVYGTRNLRVVDASVMPLIPRANPQATVYAVAERAADIIKQDHHLG